MSGIRFEHDGKPPKGSVVIVDMDGVISDASGRQHFLDGSNKDWWAFFEASVDDPPIPEVIGLVEQEVDLLLRRAQVVLVAGEEGVGRPDIVHVAPRVDVHGPTFPVLGDDPPRLHHM